VLRMSFVDSNSSALRPMVFTLETKSKAISITSQRQISLEFILGGQVYFLFDFESMFSGGFG
jgi:hypothetical protein